MISDTQFDAARALPAAQIMQGDPETVKMVNQIIPILQVIPARSHARGLAILFGVLVADMEQLYKAEEPVDFDENLTLFSILARTIYTAAKADYEHPPVPEPTPKGPARLFHLVPRSDHADQDISEPESSDAAEGWEGRPDPGSAAPGSGD